MIMEAGAMGTFKGILLSKVVSSAILILSASGGDRSIIGK